MESTRVGSIETREGTLKVDVARIGDEGLV